MRPLALTAAFAVFLMLADVAQAAAGAGDARPAASFASVPGGPPPLAALAWREGSSGSSSSASYAAAADSASSDITLPSSSTVLREAAISGAAIGAGFLLDDTFEPGSGEGTFLDEAAQAVGSPYVLVGGTALLALYGWKADAPKELNTAKKVALALAATSLTAITLKTVTKRERPDESNDDSFPSGHAANTFAVATVLDREYSGIVPWVGYGAATLVAAGRVVGNRHWFSDVVAGAVIGRFFGRLVTVKDASAAARAH
jgi:membrane-associated phospholipid phosphatase